MIGGAALPGGEGEALLATGGALLATGGGGVAEACAGECVACLYLRMSAGSLCDVWKPSARIGRATPVRRTASSASRVVSAIAPAVCTGGADAGGAEGGGPAAGGGAPAA